MKHATNRAARALLGAVIASVVALRATPAAADERPVLVLDATGSDDGQAMVIRIEKHIGPDPELAPVADLYRKPLRQPTATDTTWQAEEAVLAEARKLLTPIGYRAAAEKVRGAQDRLARFAGDAAPRALLAELVLVEGLAVAGDSGLEAARPLFLLVHRLTPGRTLDANRYRPEMVQAFEAAAVSGLSGRLEIKASGAAEVLVDGVVVPGGEPVTNLAVPAGPHIVTVRGESITSDGRRVEAVAKNHVLVELTPVLAPLDMRLGRARDRLLAATTDRARADAITALLGMTPPARHAIVIVRVGGEGGELAARLYTDRGGLGPSRPIGDDVAAAVAPLRPLASPKVRGTGNGDGRPPPPPPPAAPWWQKTWFKAGSGTLVGVVAVAVVTAIVTRDPGTSTLQGGVEVE